MSTAILQCSFFVFVDYVDKLFIYMYNIIKEFYILGDYYEKIS